MLTPRQRYDLGALMDTLLLVLVVCVALYLIAR